jgi:hypothetical protein
LREQFTAFGTGLFLKPLWRGFSSRLTFDLCGTYPRHVLGFIMPLLCGWMGALLM